MKQASKHLRFTLYEQQNHICPVCKTTIPDLRQAYYDPKKQYVICIPCHFLVHHYRVGMERGVGFDQVVEYQSLEPQKIPTKLRRKLKPEQEAARQAVADGRVVDPLTGRVMTVEEFDARLGG
jgi:hypothetical protein